VKIFKVIILVIIMNLGLAAQEKVQSEAHRKTTYFQQGYYLYILLSEDQGRNLTFEIDNNSIVAAAEQPIASAGEDINACVGSQVKLTGAGSYDPLEMLLTYHWEFQSIPLSSKAVLNGQNQQNCTFVPDLPGEYTISLTVRTPDDRAGADTVRVSVTFYDSKPYAVIEGPGIVKSLLPVTITLDGSSSYTQNGKITRYLWAIESKPPESTMAIDNKGENSIDMQLDWPGEYQVSLIVWNQLGPSEKAVHNISVSNGDPPVFLISYTRKTLSNLFMKKDEIKMKVEIQYLTEPKKIPAEYIVFRRGKSEVNSEIVKRVSASELSKDNISDRESFVIEDYIIPGENYIYLITGLTAEGVVLTFKEICL